VKRLMSFVAAGAIVCSIFPAAAEAAGQGRGHGRAEVRQDQRRGGYFSDRDVVVIREYYRPYSRTLPPGLAKKYRRTGQLPPGWAKRMRPVPVYLERDMVRLQRGYHRGIIDGRAVVYDGRGVIVDIAVLF